MVVPTLNQPQNCPTNGVHLCPLQVEWDSAKPFLKTKFLRELITDALQGYLNPERGTYCKAIAGR